MEHTSSRARVIIHEVPDSVCFFIYFSALVLNGLIKSCSHALLRMCAFLEPVCLFAIIILRIFLLSKLLMKIAFCTSFELLLTMIADSY